MKDSYLPDQEGRIHHAHHDREEFESNMWGHVDKRAEFIERAARFTGDHVKYGEWMLKVLDAWPASCEHNLSFLGHNRRAWIGHAACALAFGCPEDIVREAWGLLSDRQRWEANLAADRAIKEWEARRQTARPRPGQGGLFDA